jgi:hypothetical protein
MMNAHIDAVDVDRGCALGSLRDATILVLTMRPLKSRTCLALKIVVVCVFLITASVAMSASGAADTQTARLDGHDFEIPQRYFQDGGWVPRWLRWLPGLDDGSRELLLTISASEVAAAVPGFKPKDGRYDDDLRLRLVVLREDERRQYLDPNQFADIWNSTGSYRDRVVETDPETHFTLAYRRVEYPNSWEVFAVSLDKPMPSDLFSFWIGHCLNSHSPLTPSGALALCKSYVVVGDVAVNFTLSAQNLTHMDGIRNYLVGLVSQWLKKGTARGI